MSWQEQVRKTLKPSAVSHVTKPAAILDGCKDKEEMLDSAASNYAKADIELKAVAMVQQWVETDDLDEGETYADRLMNMIVGIADQNKDGEITEDEQGIVDIALEATWDYLAKYGVDESDITAFLEDWDADAAERIRDLLAASMPEGEQADSEIDEFVFGVGEQAAMLDGAVLDAAYRKTMAVRKGKRVRINKRISGTVRLSAKQKVAIRKAVMKSHSAVAQMRRAKSLRVRRNSGL